MLALIAGALVSTGISDPSIDTAGWLVAHLFVGPESIEVHEQLIEHVLVPYGYTHVLLQCERTRWDATPEIVDPRVISKDELSKIADLYRVAEIEVIPLIQSFGHSGWLVENPAYRHLALNSEDPFTLDPDDTEVRATLTSVWREAVELLDPKVVHFGLDEIDLRGTSQEPEHVTGLWTRHVPYLFRLAGELGVRAMVWSDMMLAPGEAIDACHGDTEGHAQRRRSVVPKGTLIADWHYRAESEPERYGSLEKWKRWGYLPIAAGWHRAENIYGFGTAAKRADVGYIQTIWAGYTLDRQAISEQTRQFAALIDSANVRNGRGEYLLKPDPSTAELRRLLDIPPTH